MKKRLICLNILVLFGAYSYAQYGTKNVSKIKVGVDQEIKLLESKPSQLSIGEAIHLIHNEKGFSVIEVSKTLKQDAYFPIPKIHDEIGLSAVTLGFENNEYVWTKIPMHDKRSSPTIVDVNIIVFCLGQVLFCFVLFIMTRVFVTDRNILISFYQLRFFCRIGIAVFGLVTLSMFATRSPVTFVDASLFALVLVLVEILFFEIPIRSMTKRLTKKQINLKSKLA